MHINPPALTFLQEEILTKRQQIRRINEELHVLMRQSPGCTMKSYNIVCNKLEEVSIHLEDIEKHL